MKNKKFGMLFVLSQAPSRKGYSFWNCVCDCGKHCVTRGNYLRSGHTKSCGCNRPHPKHGDCKHNGCTRLYGIFKQMHSRCYNQNNKRFNNYGGRGITIWAGWAMPLYSEFKKWAMSNGYKDGLTIDRKNNDMGYHPDNCQWVTRSENSRLQHQRKKALMEMMEDK